MLAAIIQTSLKKRYFGTRPVINILVSKLIFWALRHRRRMLQREYKNRPYQSVQFFNDHATSEAFQKFIGQGFDKVSLGGGAKNLNGYVNIDFVEHENVERQVIANILDLSFIPGNSLSHIHSNHVIEHLTQQQLEEQLAGYMRLLKPGGRISIRCPNALGVSHGFFFGQVPETGHKQFIELGYPEDEEFYNPEDGWYHKDLWGAYHWWHAFTGNMENQHLNLLTPTKLKKAVEQAGFRILLMTEPETSNLVLMAEKPA